MGLRDYLWKSKARAHENYRADDYWTDGFHVCRGTEIVGMVQESSLFGTIYTAEAHPHNHETVTSAEAVVARLRQENQQ